jgi:hypothetical protein
LGIRPPSPTKTLNARDARGGGARGASFIFRARGAACCVILAVAEHERSLRGLALGGSERVGQRGGKRVARRGNERVDERLAERIELRIGLNFGARLRLAGGVGLGQRQCNANCVGNGGALSDSGRHFVGERVCKCVCERLARLDGLCVDDVVALGVSDGV